MISSLLLLLRGSAARDAAHLPLFSGAEPLENYRSVVLLPRRESAVWFPLLRAGDLFVFPICAVYFLRAASHAEQLPRVRFRSAGSPEERALPTLPAWRDEEKFNFLLIVFDVSAPLAGRVPWPSPFDIKHVCPDRAAMVAASRTGEVPYAAYRRADFSAPPSIL